MVIKSINTLLSSILIVVFIAVQVSPSYGQVHELIKETGNTQKAQKRYTLFPQIHTNLDGMVSEFVRAMYQDTKGNYWFGTNTNGIIRYDGKTLENVSINGVNAIMSIREIVEDKAGNVWFSTSEGLLKYDGEKFTQFSKKDGLLDDEIWSLTIDKNGLIWVGTTEGVNLFDGKTFTHFLLPDSLVANPQHMLSEKLALKILEDRNGVIWFVTDGNGIFKYNKGTFTHLTIKNGLTDNSVSDILEDKLGNIWIGTFYGGLSKFDGKTFTNFTKDGLIDGIEIGNLYEDHTGNIWFSVENKGVYQYDGTNFTQFTTKNGLTTNLVLSLFEDNKQQIWFGSWQGICLYDGKTFMNAIEKEPWVK